MTKFSTNVVLILNCRLLAHEILIGGSEDLRILISSDYVRFFSSTPLHIVHETNLR